MQKDKYLHLSACAAIALIVVLGFSIINTKWYIAALAGFIVSMAAGFGKEYGDKCNPYNKWDWNDILADLIGSIIGISIGSIVYLL